MHYLFNLTYIRTINKIFKPSFPGQKDPLFLSDSSFFMKIAGEQGNDIGDEKYLLAYILNPSDDKFRIMSEAAKKYDRS